jgi:hypothetical protein
VVYDSGVQGGWGRLSVRLGILAKPENEEDWLIKYVAIRKGWLMGLHAPLPSTTYRMDTFSTLIIDNKLDLTLPIQVHSISITQDALMIAGAPATVAARNLLLVSPYMRGDDVKVV